jgi:DNA anti-recombination protein RmuC
VIDTGGGLHHSFSHSQPTVMDLILEALKQQFTWGLLLGLLVAAFIWKSGFSRSRRDMREIRRLESELKDLQGHLNTQLKINASGNESLQSELAGLRQQNENLRVSNAALQQKPGRAETRQLQIYEAALRSMREQAPGFAAAWEKSQRQAEADLEAADKGLLKLVRRVIPGLGNNPANPPPAIEVQESEHP